MGFVRASHADCCSFSSGMFILVISFIYFIIFFFFIILSLRFRRHLFSLLHSKSCFKDFPLKLLCLRKKAELNKYILYNICNNNNKIIITTTTLIIIIIIIIIIIQINEMNP